MELDSANGAFFVPQTHNHPVLCPGGDLKGIRKRIALHDQGMVTRGNERVLDFFEESLAVVVNFRCFSVHDLASSDDFASEGLAEALVPETHAEKGSLPRRVENQVERDPGLVWGTWARGDNDTVRGAVHDLLRGDLVVSRHLYLGAQFSQILDKVVRKGIVVIQDKDSGHKTMLMRIRDHTTYAAQMLGGRGSRRAWATFAAPILMAGLWSPVAAIELSDIAMDGNAGGFVIRGINAGDGAGTSVGGAGDVNGDGVPDVVIGAPGADGNTGKAYVVFGKATGAAIDLSNVERGNDGFAMNGIDAGNLTGSSVSGAGDVNGDGLEDVVVGSPENSAPNRAGRAYMVFGKSGGAAVDLESLSLNSAGFVIDGSSEGDELGTSVSGLGDMNGDGITDMIIGAPRVGEGKSYVIYGKPDSDTVTLTDLGGSTGFRLEGADADDNSGASVSGAGDVNGDGIPDVIIGAPESAVNGAGKCYVVFGDEDGMNVSLSDVEAGIGGFVINGIALADQFGTAVACAGDVNGDGLSDVIIGTEFSDVGSIADAGEAFVIFGKTDTEPVNLLAVAFGPGGGFLIRGTDAFDFAGSDVSGAGDVNGDGLADVLIGAKGEDPGGVTNAGVSYVIYGRSESGFLDLLDVAAGNGGYPINGINVGDQAGVSVSGAGDMNGDGLADMIIGAKGADPGGNQEAGECYVVFSQETPPLTATYKARTRPGDGPGGRIVPETVVGDCGVRIDFSDEDFGGGGAGGASEETVTITRSNAAISNLPPKKSVELEIADVVWEVATDRINFNSALLTLKYLDSRIAPSVEARLSIYQAPTLAGPWTRLPTSIDPVRNNARANVTSFSFFALAGTHLTSVIRVR